MNAIFLFGWILTALITLVYLARAFQYRQSLRIPSLLLRVGMLIVLLLLSLERFSGQLELQTPLFVLIDTSSSMDEALQRDTHVAPPLNRVVLPKWIHKRIAAHFPEYAIHPYDLFLPWDASAGNLSRNRSPLENALTDFRNRSGVSTGYSLLLVSDGRDTETPGMPLEAAGLLRSTGVKVHTLAIEPPQIEDTELDDIGHPRVAFLNQPSRLEVKVRYTLKKPGTTHLVLMDGQSVLAREEINLPAGSGTSVLKMQWSPSRLGEVILSLRLQPLPDESKRFNNHAYLSVSVHPNRLRVLHIAGRPSWDVFHLRRVIKEMPDADLISFFILRDPFEDTQNVPENELALIRFPVRELFMRQLFKFDTVVFHNFAIKRFLRNPDFQQSFQKFLANGKRIIVIGGEQVSGNRDYQELFLSGTGKEAPELKFIHHPDWGFQEGRWLMTRQLQRLPGFQVFRKEPGDVPSRLLNRTPYQHGRVDWVLDPGSWRWQHKMDRTPSDSTSRNKDLGNGNQGISHQHSALWQSLLTQPFHQRQRIFRDFSPGRPYHEREKIAGILRVPTRAPKIRVRLVEQTLNQTRFQDWLDVHQGEATLVLPKLDPGLYLLKVNCECQDMQEVSHPLVVVGEWLELRKSAPNRAWLRTLATLTGGRMIVLTKKTLRYP